MFAIRRQEGEDGIRFNRAKSYLGIIFLLTGISMFTAQLESHIDSGSFEKLNPLMLLFFFLTAQGFLLSFMVLYASRHAYLQTFRRTVLPVLILFAIYTLIYLFTGDVQVYSAHDFFAKLPEAPLLMLRSVILLSMLASILYCIYLCHRAKETYNRLIRNYFSETDFARSIWLSNLLACAEALSLWVLLAYFYTTPMLEVISGTMIVAVFSFYVKAFYDYSGRYEKFRPALLLSRQDNTPIPDTGTDTEKITDGEKPNDEDKRCAFLLDEWKKRPDKPFTTPGVTIADVAKDLSLPRYRISNYINREQKNFCSWINELRIGEAVRLLEEKNGLSISEIAEHTGFCDLPAFSRAFRKIKEISPSRFRNNYTGKPGEAASLQPEESLNEHNELSCDK